MHKYAQKLMVGQWLLMIVLTLALVIVGYGYSQLHNCTNDYFKKSQTVQRVRSEAAQKNDAAVDTMVDEVLVAKSAEDTRVALEHYREQRRQVEETRRKNPVPAPPDHC